MTVAAEHIVRSAHPEFLKAIVALGFSFGVLAFVLAIILFVTKQDR